MSSIWPPRRRRLPIVALITLVAFGVAGTLAATPAPAGAPLPAWLLGTWLPVKVYQIQDLRYGETDPQHDNPGHPLTITPERLTFMDHGCQGSSVTPQRGLVAQVLEKWLHVPRDHTRDLGMPRETRPVNYLEVHCRQSLGDMGDGKGFLPAEHPDTWYIVLRGANEIEMPYYRGSWVKFRRPSPNS